MTWTAPATLTTGQLVTAAIWNQQVGDNLAHIGAHTRAGTALSALTSGTELLFNVNCAVTATGTQSINDSTDTALTFNAERWDNGTMHDTATNNTRITIPSGKGGLYLFHAHVEWASNATGYREARFRVNGNSANEHGAMRITAVNGEVTRLPISTQIDLDATDYVEVIVRQTSGGALNVNSNSVSRYAREFRAALIGVA